MTYVLESLHHNKMTCKEPLLNSWGYYIYWLNNTFENYFVYFILWNVLFGQCLYNTNQIHPEKFFNSSENYFLCCVFRNILWECLYNTNQIDPEKFSYSREFAMCIVFVEMCIAFCEVKFIQRNLLCALWQIYPEKFASSRENYFVHNVL